MSIICVCVYVDDMCVYITCLYIRCEKQNENGHPEIVATFHLGDALLKSVAVCCRVSRCVAVCCSVCSVSQCVAVCCSVVQCAAPLRPSTSAMQCCSVLVCVAVYLQCICSVLQCVAMCCNVLQCVAACCLQCVVVCYNVMSFHFGDAVLQRVAAVCCSCSVLQCCFLPPR